MFILTILDWLIPKASAANPLTQYCGALHNKCGGGATNFVSWVAEQAITFISSIIGAVVGIALLWGAVKIVTSGGNEEGRNQGKTIITSALIGAALAIIARVLIEYVVGLVWLWAGF